MGKWFLVCRIDQNRVYVVDGKSRPVERPKPKNPRHLDPKGMALTENDQEVTNLTNRQVRQIIARLVPEFQSDRDGEGDR